MLCSPEGIRTLVAGLRSQSPRPLDDGAMYCYIFLEQTRTNQNKLEQVMLAGVPGLEPRQAEPESAGLPITPYPKVKAVSAKDTLLFIEELQP